jgi:dTDP-4-dehydrorhamnose 3,5-epimerase-like enzyme
MQFLPTPLSGAFTIELEKRGDDRGFFARYFCEDEFAKAGLETRFKQINTSLSARAGTLRGMHYQLPPAAACGTSSSTCVRSRRASASGSAPNSTPRTAP